MMKDFVIEDGILIEYRGDQKNVIIPDSVKIIDDSVFENCTSLQSVTIPNSVTIIGDYAFYGCTSLINITIPNSVISIGHFAFSGVGILGTTLTVSESNPNYTAEDGVLFNKDKTKLISALNNKTTYIIPDSVTIIGDNAFYSCSNLQKITIPNSVTSIGAYIFYNCSNLQSITIPNSVTRIDNYAFYYCRSLTSVIIPDSVTSIGNFVFRDCINLSSVTISNNVTSIGSSVFWGCNSLKSPKHNYKAFNLDEYGNIYAARNNMKYKLGRTEKLDDKIEICHKGFHYCTNIFDIFSYYYGEYDRDYVVCLCDVNENNIQTHKENSKCCTNILTPTRILTRGEVIGLINGKDIF